MKMVIADCDKNQNQDMILQKLLSFLSCFLYVHKSKYDINWVAPDNVAVVCEEEGKIYCVEFVKLYVVLCG